MKKSKEEDFYDGFDRPLKVIPIGPLGPSAQAVGSAPCNIDEAASYKWAADVLTSVKLSPNELQRLADKVAGAIRLAYDLGIKTGRAQNAKGEPLRRSQPCG